MVASHEDGAGVGVAVARRVGRGGGRFKLRDAAAERVSRPTVTKWRNRFAERRLEGLLDEPRPGRPRTVSDEQVQRIVTTTLESTPKDATHWSTRSLAAHLGVSQDAVWRTWQAFALQPHRQEKFKLSTDPQFVEKVYDICGLYLNPPERAVVLCVMRRARSRHSTVPGRSCRCSRALPNGNP